ncbi:MAG: TRAP transporter substrate-binding protein [Alphaproteobacteria bacterium]|nr:TRAP transporter substrate-binding protein [Alphaproteobacteria bacterium]
MSRIVPLAGAAIAAFVALIGIAPASANAQDIVLRFNRWVPPTHHFHARIMAPWAERVEKATEGRVKIEFTASSLGAPPRQFDLAATGIADITAGNQTYTPDRFVLSRVAELPFLGDSAEALSVAQWRVHEKFFASAGEYKGTKLLTVFNNGPFQIFTAKKPIATVEDLKNLKMRAAGGTPTEVATALGVVPIGAPVTEAYEMLSRGIVDGTFLPPDSIRSFRMDKFLAHQVKVPAGLFNAAFFVVMNEAKWNALSEANRKAIWSVSGEVFAREAGRIWDDQDRIANEQFRDSGMKISTASPAMMAELKSRLSGVEQGWIREAAAKGVDGKAAVAMLRAEAARHKPMN